MTDQDAIDVRCSRRSYTDKPIADEIITKLQSAVDKYNKESGLNIQLVLNGGEAFQGLSRSYGMFHGVSSFIALVGKVTENLNEVVGYYGELLVLEATKLGLGTCWVAGTFDRKHCPCIVKEGESLVCVITVGNVEVDLSFREKAIHALTHSKRRPIEYFYTSDTTPPDWFMEVVKSVQKAPSSANSQPVHVTYKSGTITISINNPNPHQLIDLGIAKSHLELVTGGKFKIGNHAKLND
ncbi:MAG TPA: nitroreductase family protein [Mobilitalea sp.]|nr:nitroreductase family protein [Mobilitalea sp.]